MEPLYKSDSRLFEELRKREDGAEYLRRIKQLSSEPAEPAGAASPGAPAASVSSSGREQRRSPRFHCAGSAEFRVDGSDVRMWGTLSDISLHGCYVEMNNTFPVDTKVSLLLEAMGVRVRTHAVVRVSYPFLGMGLGFLKIEPAQLQQLKRLVEMLAGQTSAVTKESAAPTSTYSLADVDPRVMLDALTEFFRSNLRLSRTEFYDLAKRARR